jgi:hypothetical protein
LTINIILSLPYPSTLHSYDNNVDDDDKTVPRPELNAIVPTLGFNLSTWSLPIIKTVWEWCHRNSNHLSTEVGQKN